MDNSLIGDFTTGKITDAVINVYKEIPDVWQKLNEDQQQSMIERLDMEVRKLADGMCDRVAAKEYPIIEASVESVTFKKGIKASITIPGESRYRHDLADHADKQVLLVMTDYTEFHDNPTVQAEPDQPSLDIPEDEDEGTVAAGSESSDEAGVERSEDEEPIAAAY